MKVSDIKLFSRFARTGVVHREEVKNDLATVKRFMRHGLVRKVFRKGKVYYHLTSKAVPLLELQRQLLVNTARLLASFPRASTFYQSLLDDVRFVDEHHAEAPQFQLLGDWQLTRAIVPSQLELAQCRDHEARERI